MYEWSEIRRRVFTGEISKRAACPEYELAWHTLKKILDHEVPPGYRLRQPRRKPKLEPYLPIIEQILKDDQQAPKKQLADAVESALDLDIVDPDSIRVIVEHRSTEPVELF